MPILREYKKQLLLSGVDADLEQEITVQQLAKLEQLLAQQHIQQQTITYKLRSLFNLKESYPQGCYIWGDVGRGKTWLMDMFYDNLDDDSGIGKQKIRMHFHHFMQAIHDQLSLIGEQKQPLKIIARAFAKNYKLLCLDEFHVSDITDAMLLYGLLETLFAEGVVLVATSNRPPDDLYKNGLQRERFLPAIELIKSHCNVLKLNGQTDHRLRLLEKADIWYALTEQTDTLLEQRFLELSTSPAQQSKSIHISYRQIKSIFCSSDVVWLDFHVICGDQRGSADYIEIAKLYHTVFISNIPVMDDGYNDKARRFINLIDEFYDRNVNLLVSAESSPDKLYCGKQFEFEFNRTISRLQEMRSHEYMHRPHKIN